jgi:hypothetical protein
MLMYTSCGWFFDEISGTETVQVIQYAARALQLAEELFALRLEDGFKEGLSRAQSNLPEQKDGACFIRSGLNLPWSIWKGRPTMRSTPFLRTMKVVFSL